MTWQRYNKNLRKSLLLAEYFSFWTKCSRWDRYLGMTAAMTQVPVPTAFDDICIFLDDSVRRIGE